MLIAGLVISPVGAVIKKKNVRKISKKISTKVANNVVNQALTPVNAAIAAVDEVKVATGPHHNVPSGSFTDVTGATATIDVPAGTNALIVARFTASSICVGGGCYVRILIGGVEADPPNVSPWDSGGVSDANIDYEASAMDRSRTVGAGTHTVQVQARLGSGATFFDLDNWHMAVERILVQGTQPTRVTSGATAESPRSNLRDLIREVA
ncbi:MAG: hypothetical protein ACRDH8_09535 [Actinomycetota bacterium]